MDEPIYMIPVLLNVVKNNGKKVTVKLLGISPYTDDEWNEIIRNGKTLEDLLAEGEFLQFGKPMPLQKVLTGDEYGDIVDMIRDELIAQRPDPS